MRVHLGSDHAGLELKDHLLMWLVDHGYEAVDHGPFVYDALDDYPCFCLRAAEGVAADRAEGLDSLGVVIGGSGNGEQIAANKVEGIRAAIAINPQHAELSRRHNDANVLVLGSMLTPQSEEHALLDAWFSAPFDGGRHERRVGQITDYERTHCKG